MNEHTILYRQIHPSFVQDGYPTSQAFRPTPKDQCQLSVYAGDMITAEAAWDHYTRELQLSSWGVMGISVGECQTESIAVRPDPGYFAEHALVDFSGLTEKECRSKSKTLQSKARARGWLFRSA